MPQIYKKNLDIWEIDFYTTKKPQHVKGSKTMAVFLVSTYIIKPEKLLQHQAWGKSLVASMRSTLNCLGKSPA
jgi:hypothetical protein